VSSPGVDHAGSGAPAAERRPHPVGLLATVVLPLAAYFVLQKALGNATGALAITDGIPLIWLAGVGILHRRLDRLALVAAAVFGLALVLSIAFGGSALPLELRRSVFPGVVGLACLISLAVRQPLLLALAKRFPRPDPPPGTDDVLDRPGSRQALTVLTAIAGVFGIADAVAQVVLALTMSTEKFVVAARVASYVIIGGGLLVAATYMRWKRARLPKRD
jgi:hypothetical protein